jgi:protein-tyrosine-phosphatase
VEIFDAGPANVGFSPAGWAACSRLTVDTASAEPISPELVLVDPHLADLLRQHSASAPFRVVFVCTGNRFRSALAEAAFRADTSNLPLEVASYGILDLGAAGPLSQAVRVAGTYGLEISRHVARPLTSADLSEMSLVIGFEARHAEAAISIAGARPERAFLLLELVDLLGASRAVPGAGPIERAVSAVARAHTYRSAESTSRSRREIPDPMEFSESDQMVVGRIVYEQVTRLARALFGPVH